MTTLDQWSSATFDIRCERDSSPMCTKVTSYPVRILTPQQAEERNRLNRIRFARGPGTRRFAENARTITLIVALLAIIGGLTLAAIGVTP